MARRNKGLNMEKVMDIRSEVEEVMEVTPVIVQDMAQHIGASLEDVDALREMIVEEQMKEINKFEKELNDMKEKIDNGIRYAILSGKDACDTAKYLSGKQLMAIFKSYVELAGCEMSEAQKSYIKTLNSKQISNILHTLNVARRTLVVA